MTYTARCRDEIGVVDLVDLVGVEAVVLLAHDLAAADHVVVVVEVRRLVVRRVVRNILQGAGKGRRRRVVPVHRVV